MKESGGGKKGETILNLPGWIRRGDVVGFNRGDTGGTIKKKRESLSGLLGQTINDGENYS